MSTKRQVDKTKTKQVRIDASIHKLLKVYVAKRGETLRSVIEGELADILGVDNDK
ncbi:MAG: hypothetical protein WD231_04410 [Candidatus Woykebacteria bacterium]